MTVLYYAAGVLFFVVGLALSVGLHELGHLVPGKLFDVKVSQYFIGFGRTLWSRRRGETEYGIKALPLGGYVKLVGMLPPAHGQPETEQATGERRVRTGSTGIFSQLVSDARAAEYEFVDAHDHGRLFYEKPWWQRAIIWGCGVSINLVIAFLLFAVTFMGYGVQEPTNTVAKVYACVKVATPGTSQECAAKDPVAPAAKMGLRPGDRLLAFNGQQAGSYAHLQKLIRANGAGPVTLSVERDGQRLTLHGDTTVNLVRKSAESEKTIHAGYLGISPTQELRRQDVGFVVSTMADGTWSTLKAIGSLPPKVYHVGRAALGLEKRDPKSPMSVVGAGRVAGELASSDTETFAQKFFSVVLLLAGLNLFLGLINVVPLPPFDGAGLAASFIDGIRRGLARLFRRPMPQSFDYARLLPLSYAMALVLIVLSLVLVIGDVVAPVSIN